MSVNIRPLADRVLIQPAAAEETTASGIIIPDTAQEKPQEGKVVAVGNPWVLLRLIPKIRVNGHRF